MRQLIPLIFALLVGCVALPPQIPPPAGPIVLSANTGNTARLWQREAARRFVNPVVVICHGAELNGSWYAFPDAPMRPMPVEAMAQTVHAIYPGRPVVLICCNARGCTLHVKGVWYAKDIVWCIPDDDVSGRRCRTGGVGAIAQFVPGQ